MKTINSYLLRALCTLMIGLLLVANPDTPVLLIRVIAALFALTGCFSLFNYLIARFGNNKEVRPTFPIAGCGSLLLGLLLGFYPEAFLQFFMYLLGGMILLLGFNQLISIINYRRVAPIRWTLFIFPLLIIGVGLYTIYHYDTAATLPFIILGICCICNGLSDLFFGIRLHHYERQNQKFTSYEEVTDTVEEMSQEKQQQEQ